jgi:hypothetical protein
MKKLFVGGIPWSVSDAELKSAFEPHGPVVEAKVITDRETGRSRGFGFVTMSNDADAANAIKAMDGSLMGPRTINVNEAQERSSGGGGPFSIHAVPLVGTVSKRGLIPRIAMDRLGIGDDERDAALSIRHVDAVETCLLRDGETERFLGERHELFVAVPTILDEVAARLGRPVGVRDLPRLQLAVELLEWRRRRNEVHVVLHRRLLTILGRDLRSDEERVPE